MVEILRWPKDKSSVTAATRPGTVRLVVVDDGTEPPVASACCQDWMWRSGSATEFRLRLRQLLFRSLSHGWSPPTIDEFGVLHVALRSVPLPPGERKVAAVLLDRFNQVVATEELVSAVWPSGVTRKHVVTVSISRLRSRVAAVGLEIRSLGGRGYVITPTATLAAADDDNAVWFDDEVDPASWLGNEVTVLP